MTKIILWVCGIVFGLIFIAFAVHNFNGVDLDLWPLPFTLRLPLFLLVLGAIAVGLLAGLFVAWAAGSRTRRLARARRREVRTLEKKLEGAGAPRRDTAALPAARH